VQFAINARESVAEIAVAYIVTQRSDLALNAEGNDELAQKLVGELRVVVEHGHQVGECDRVHVAVRQRLDSVAGRVLVRVTTHVSLP